jgi:hypothetical protein
MSRACCKASANDTRSGSPARVLRYADRHHVDAVAQLAWLANYGGSRYELPSLVVGIVVVRREESVPTLSQILSRNGPPYIYALVE